MKRIVFRYQDRFTNGNWNETSCEVESLEQCIEIYGLKEPDVRYEIVSIEEIVVCN